MIHTMDKGLAAQIVDVIRQVVNKDINFIDKKGIIIASTNKERVGRFNKAGYEVALTREMIIVSEENRLEGTQKGINYPIIIGGAKDIMPAILRIVTSGVLAGILIQTGSAAKIADQIVKTLGEKRALFALALATMILTATGVFIDIAVITVAPIALAIGKKLNYSKLAILFAMIGGGKCGNVISPNPNTIAAAENFGVELSNLMFANIFGPLQVLL